MDSGYEVVLVDANVATTNGLNGTHEEVTEMKTRSKIALGGAGEGSDDESVKPKKRLIRTAITQKTDDRNASDNENKDKKKGRSVGDTEEAAAGAVEPVSKEAANNASNNTQGVKMAVGAVSVTDASACVAKPSDEDSSEVSTTTTADSAKASAATVPTPSKKKAQEPDDDSGVNSRASSVSNDDVTAPARMRTRSSRAPEISTSTSTYRRGAAARVPISVYACNTASFNDDLLPLISAASGSKGVTGSSSSLKRKAVVYVEKMEDEEGAAQEQGAANNSAEPSAKRRASSVYFTGAGIITSLQYPLRKLRHGIAAIRPYKGVASAKDTSTTINADSVNHEKCVEDAMAVADESMDTSAQAGSVPVARSSDPQQPVETANTCSLM